jgi:transcription-repair coupling factor (superfamily II helicase)
LERRALTLWRLAQGQGDFVLLTARALARRTVRPEQLRATGATLRRDEDHAPEELIELLLASGYVREDPLGAVGEFSLRGGILDVWSPGHERPVRVEFFGDTVDSIREFDPETQLSVAQLQRIEIVPMREYALGADDFRLWAGLARERWSDERYARALRDRTVHADEGETFAGWEWLVSLVHSTPASAFDYLQSETVFVVDEPAAIETFLGNTYETLRTRYAETEGADEIALSPEELYLTAEELRAAVGGVPRVELRTLGRTAAATDERFAGEAEAAAAVSIGRARTAAAAPPLFLFPAVERAPEIEWSTRASRRYHGRIAELAADVRRALEEHSDARVVFAMPSAGVAERIGEMLAEYNVGARVVFAGEPGALEDRQALVAVGRLSGGFELPASRLVVHVENDLFDEAHDGATVEHRAPGTGGASASPTKRPRKKSKTAAFLSDFRDLKVGDFVVHIDHGIARFGGLQTLDLGPCSTRRTRNCTSPSNASISCSVIRARRGTSRCSTASAASAGRRRRPRPNAPCATWPTNCCASTPSANSSAATPTRPTARGNASSRTASSTCRRPIRRRPSKT